jgi:MFS family permease
MNNGQRWRITTVVVLGLFMAALDNSIVSVTLPAAFLHYLMVGRDSMPAYWGAGAWLYFIGMVVVAMGGIPLLFVKKRELF